MPTPKMWDRVKVAATASGVGAFSVGAAAAGGWLTPVAAGAVSGDNSYYCAVQGELMEIGLGTLTSGAPWSWSRDTVLVSTNAGAKVVFAAGSIELFCVCPSVVVSSFATEVGTVIESAVAPGTGTWLTCDGANYDDTSYPLLSTLMPEAPGDGVTWTARTLPSSSNWQSVTYGNGVFVAVAYGSAAAATSPDGITWTARTLPSSSNWRSVAYGNGVFVAVAYGSTAAATSPDGITWTARTLPSSSYWQSVTYGNGVFVAISNSTGTVAATSPDGITWTARTLATSQAWSSVTYGGGLFVAVGNTVTANSSPDGITWTARTLPNSQSWQSITYGNGVFVAVPSNGTASGAKSSDGITWSTMTLPSPAAWYSVTYGNGVLVAVANASASAARNVNGSKFTVPAIAARASNILPRIRAA